MKINKVAFREYLLIEKNYSPLTVAAYSKDIEAFESFVEKNFKGQALEEVSYAQIRNWIAELVTNEISSVSVNRKMASLKAFYKFLQKTKQIGSSPMLYHKSLKVSKPLQIPFSENELVNLDIVFGDVTDFKDVRDRLIVEILYTTGIRRAELISLKYANVNVGASVIKVVGKRNKERIVPLLPVVLSQIRAYVEVRNALEVVVDEDLFFLSNKGLKLSESFVYRLINSYFSRVSQKVKKSPHILRHTFATHLLNNGADLNSVKELLGHASLASTQVYTHSSLAELKKVYSNSHPRNKE